MNFGTLVHHAYVPGYTTLPQIFKILPRDLVMVFRSRKNGVQSLLNFERSLLSPLAKIKKLRQYFVELPVVVHFAKTV